MSMRLLPNRPRRLLRAFLAIWVLSSLAVAAAQDDAGQQAGTTDGPAEIRLQRAGDETSSSVELGQQLHLEVVITPGTDPVTGYTFYLSYDADVFSLVAASGEGSEAKPFADGDFLDGVELLNRSEHEDGQTILSMAEAGGVRRPLVTEAGIAATLTLDVNRRPFGDETVLELLAVGHRMSHYTSSVAPGAEQNFGSPLGSLALRVTGFQIQDLPDTTVVEGAGEQVVFADLDQFVDQIGAQVMWSSNFIDGLNTTIEPGGRVTMRPEGIVGEHQVIFRAHEDGEGNEDIDTVSIRVLSPPRISGFPPTITFAEDSFSGFVQLDDVVSDLDDLDQDLTWKTTNSANFAIVTIDAQRRALFSAAPDSFGTTQIELVVVDETGLTDTVRTQVIVTPVNDPPLIQRREPVYPRLGADGAATVPLAELLSDADDPLTGLDIELLADNGLQAQVSEDGTEIVISGSEAGRGLIQIMASDSEQTVEGRLVAIVLEEDQSIGPQIGPLTPLRFLQGITGTLDLANLATDDSPASSLFWTPVAPNELHPSVTGTTLLVSAQPDFVGPSAVVLIVTDAELHQDSATLPVIVLSSDEAAAPFVHTVAKIGLVSAEAAGAQTDSVVIFLDEVVDDPDTPVTQLVWTATASSGLQADLDSALRRVTLTAQVGLAGIGSLTLTATDPQGMQHTRSIPVLVSEPGGGPILNVPSQVVLEDAGDKGRVDLDALVFDDEDFDSELLWTVGAAEGVVVELDPVSHLLRVQRSDESNVSPPPSEALILLTVEDTQGQTQSKILNVQLPPVFDILALPELVVFPGGEDSSLVLSDFSQFETDPVALDWQVGMPVKLTARIDTSSLRVHVASPDPEFIGFEVLQFTATDPSGRSRTATARVSVRGRGLAPQIRALPSVLVRAGEQNTDVDLDDFVVDDDADSNLTWSVSSPADVVVEVDSLTHIVSVTPLETASGPRTAQLLVRDPAGNTDLALLEITVLRGGEPPILAELPQLLLIAGTPEQALNLDLFVSDADTPVEDLTWLASAEPGIGARVEDRRLLISVPAGQQGVRRVIIAAIDPQGNRDEAPLTILIQQDDQAPTISIQASRNRLTPDRLDLEFTTDEDLGTSPQIELNGVSVMPSSTGPGMWSVAYPIPVNEEDQRLTVGVRASDAAGNESTREVEISLRRVGAAGGSALSADNAASVNVPDAAAQPGRIVVLRQMDASDLPEGAAEGGPVYELDVAAGNQINEPIILSLFAGSSILDPLQGMQRWNPMLGDWEDVPAAVDTASAWISAALRKPGLYRRGQVEPENRRAAQRLSNHPNPFNGMTQIEYEVTRSGPVRVQIYNILGQRVRLLVDDPLQQDGLWAIEWDGRSDGGGQLGSGVYYYQVQEAGGIRLRSMLLLR
ncbi:MAG: T9SS type A sorting domain-containing protein [Gemmatimonadetes bacterium]|nr:T9SS type A sorting domain-containing protein [Gemmatimonadota bacterium]